MKKVLFLISILIFTQNSKAGVIPVAASLDGVGGVFGAAYTTNLGNSNIIVGGATGDLNAIGGLYRYYITPNFEVSAGALTFKDASLVTTYERALADDEDKQYILNTEGQAYALGSKLGLFSNYLVLGASATQSTIKFVSVDDDEGEEIDLAGANLFDVETLNLKFSLNINLFDNPNQPSYGVALKSSLANISGRTGQSDQQVFNYGATALIPLHSYFAIVLKGNHSDAIVDVNSKYDSATEIRDALDADCGSITDIAERTKCQDLENRLVNYILANNELGTADPLGGTSGLRSFRQFRFRAAHTAVYQSELHTNLSRLFGLSIDKSALLFVLFYDQGFAADDKSELFDDYEHSHGAGLKFIKGSNSINLVGAKGSQDSSSWFLSFGSAF